MIAPPPPKRSVYVSVDEAVETGETLEELEQEYADKRKGRKKSPTQFTLERCKKMGWIAGIVERWVPNPYSPMGGVRSDLFGFCDILAVSPHRPGVTLIQCTTFGNSSSRVKKILTATVDPKDPQCREDAEKVVKQGNRIEVWGWRKEGAWWRVRRQDISFTELGHAITILEEYAK